MDFRGGLGEASVSKASPNEEKSINQLSKNGEHYKIVVENVIKDAVVTSVKVITNLTNWGFDEITK